MPADWAAQRVKNLDLGKAVLNAITPSRNQKDITSLIEEFQYPKLGPGMMWERCRDLVEKDGAIVRMNTEVRAIHIDGGKATGVTVALADGSTEHVAASHVISTMPMAALVRAIDPPPPAAVLAAGKDLHYRDFLTVALVVPEASGFPDNWIYIHATDVKVGRIQNFGSWSPFMVQDGKTCLGLEFFVTEGDPLWTMADSDLVALAKRELVTLRLADAQRLENGYVVRVPKAYPVYDATYKANVAIMREWLEAEVRGVYPVGRNGMHRYNNQDHSMYTAMLSVENILGADHDVWDVNVDEEYHEEKRGREVELTGRIARPNQRRSLLPEHLAESGTVV
jgi:protoporphyrinogen oxidase